MTAYNYIVPLCDTGEFCFVKLTAFLFTPLTLEILITLKLHLLVLIFTNAIKCSKSPTCCWRYLTYLFVPLSASVNLLQLLYAVCLSLHFKLCSYCCYLVTLLPHNFVLQFVMSLQISCRILLD